MLLILHATTITNHPPPCRKNKMSIPQLPSLLLYLFLLPFHAISQSTTIQNDQNILPPFICDHKNLPHPDLNYNYITGNFPTVLYNCTNLRYLDLSQNYFLGNIPDHISRSSLELQYSRLFGNNLSGDFPVISRLSKLPSLQRHSGYLNDIPDGLWKVSSLEKLMMSDNSFASELPQKLAPKLSILQISNNKFSGKRPPGVCFWTSLRDFRASNNLFNGGNPEDLTSLPNLATLLLDGNKLSGELPATVVSCNSLNTLNFSRNQVTGQIPEGLGLLKVLTVLHLSRNNVSGQIRGELGGRQLVSANNLTKTIPSKLDNSACARSFRDNPGLCSDNPLTGLISCSSRSQTGPSSKISSQSVSIAAILTCLMILCSTRKDEVDSEWDHYFFPNITFRKCTILKYYQDENNLIRLGGSKKVYKIRLDQPDEFVVVRKIPNTIDLKRNRLNIPEVEILRQIQHPNIVKLIGYMWNKISTLAIYEYLEKGSLDHWLHRKQTPVPPIPGLDWPKRLHIAVGVAKGLSYMHHNGSPVVHMDVKSSNILLDSDFNAKIAKFKSAKFLANSSGSRDRGPEYAHKAKENAKTDVYNFGVILLELVTGKEAGYKKEHSSLAEWAMKHDREDRPIAEALDNDVNEPMYSSAMSKVFTLGVWCTSMMPNNRPTMMDVCKSMLQCSPTVGVGTEENEPGHLGNRLPPT